MCGGLYAEALSCMTTHQPLGYSSGLDQQGSAWIISRRPPRNLPPRWRPSVNKLGASASIRRPSGWRIRGETESISSGLKRPQTKVSRMRRIFFFFFKMVTERRQRRHIYTVKLITDDVVMSMSTFLFIQASIFNFSRHILPIGSFITATPHRPSLQVHQKSNTS